MCYKKNFFPVFSCVIICFFIVAAFSNNTTLPWSGDVEGYVFPKEAKPRVELVLPNPKKAGDTIHKVAVPNAAGYFKFNNVPEGTHSLLYFPKDMGVYKSASGTVEVSATGVARAESVTLEKQ